MHQGRALSSVALVEWSVGAAGQSLVFSVMTQVAAAALSLGLPDVMEKSPRPVLYLLFPLRLPVLFHLPWVITQSKTRKQGSSLSTLPSGRRLLSCVVINPGAFFSVLCALAALWACTVIARERMNICNQPVHTCVAAACGGGSSSASCSICAQCVVCLTALSCSRVQYAVHTSTVAAGPLSSPYVLSLRQPIRGAIMTVFIVSFTLTPSVCHINLEPSSPYLYAVFQFYAFVWPHHGSTQHVVEHMKMSKYSVTHTHTQSRQLEKSHMANSQPSNQATVSLVQQRSSWFPLSSDTSVLLSLLDVWVCCSIRMYSLSRSIGAIY